MLHPFATFPSLLAGERRLECNSELDWASVNRSVAATAPAMKFGKLLSAEQWGPWRDIYIPYKSLKKLLKRGTNDPTKYAEMEGTFLTTLVKAVQDIDAFFDSQFTLLDKWTQRLAAIVNEPVDGDLQKRLSDASHEVELVCEGVEWLKTYARVRAPSFRHRTLHCAAARLAVCHAPGSEMVPRLHPTAHARAPTPSLHGCRHEPRPGSSATAMRSARASLGPRPVTFPGAVDVQTSLLAHSSSHPLLSCTSIRHTAHDECLSRPHTHPFHAIFSPAER